MSAAGFAATDDVDEKTLREPLFRFIIGRLRDPAASEDLVQETYLRLYDYRSTRPVSNVGAFCFAIARNLVRDQLRRRQAAPMVQLEDELPCPAPAADEVVAHRERVETLKRALSAMPPLRREVFTRRRLDGQSPAEIASELGLSAAAVEKHLVRAVADLHQAMGRAQGARRTPAHEVQL